MGRGLRIAFLTGSRSEWGYIRPILRLADNDPDLAYELIVTNMHLLPTFGSTVTADKEDIVRFNGATFSMFVDASAAGVPAGVDLDAFEYLDSNGHLLLSFDTSGSAGGVAFDKEDVLEWACRWCFPQVASIVAIKSPAAGCSATESRAAGSECRCHVRHLAEPRC